MTVLLVLFETPRYTLGVKRVISASQISSPKVGEGGEVGVDVVVGRGDRARRTGADDGVPDAPVGEVDAHQRRSGTSKVSIASVAVRGMAGLNDNPLRGQNRWVVHASPAAATT